MRTIKQIKDEMAALQKELKALKPEKPVRLSIRDLDVVQLTTMVDSYIEYIWAHGQNPDLNEYKESDFKGWIFEAAVEMVYGKEIWGKIREVQK